MRILPDDVRFAFRALSKHPAFFLTAVVTLALGTGANTALFSVLNAVVLKPLPYRDPDRLTVIWQRHPGGGQNPVTGRDYVEWRKQAGSFAEMAGFASAPANLTAGGEPQQVEGARVSASFFPLLGVTLKLGRNFLPDEERLGADGVAILSDGLWKRQFGADPSVIGRVLDLSNRPVTVIGILPEDFQIFSKDLAVWTPLSIAGDAQLSHNTLVVARLRPGVTIEQGRREMELISRRMEAEYPGTNKSWGTVVAPLKDELVGDFRRTLLTLLCAVGFVLLIACANVANLLLTRAMARQKEMAVRSALGAGRGRLARQVVTESVLLGILGGAVGLLFAYASIRILLTSTLANLPRTEGVRIDGGTLVFSLLVSAGTGVLFGLLPALRLAKADLHPALKEGSRGSTGAGGGRFRNMIVVTEVALSFLLLTGAGLTMRSFLRLQNMERGFRPENLLALRLSIPRWKYPTDERLKAYYAQILQQVESVPGVEGVGASTSLPLDGQRFVGMYFRATDRPPVEPSERSVAYSHMVSAGYFQALGMPILEGRPFSEQDREGSAPVTIVSRSLARRYWAGQSALGKQLAIGDPELVREVVGVVGDIRYPTSKADDSIEMYLPFAQTSWPDVFISVRTSRDPAALAQAVSVAIHAIDKDQPISGVRTMVDRIAEVNVKPRWNMLLMGLFAAVALVLTTVGIYGVIAYSTSQRTQEMGIRMALGARPGEILKMVVGRGLLLALAGLGLGLAGYFALFRVLASFLYGMSAGDGVTLAVVAALLAAVAALASFVPALRATRIDPMKALRSE